MKTTIKELVVVLAILALITYLINSTVYAKTDDKIFWCHTEPNGNSQTLHLPIQALENAGHVGADGNPLHAGDYAGECLEPSPSPEPSPEVSPSPSPEVSPEPTPEPSPKPTPSPEPSPTPTPTPEPSPSPSPSPSSNVETKNEEEKSVEVQMQEVVKRYEEETGSKPSLPLK